MLFLRNGERKVNCRRDTMIDILLHPCLEGDTPFDIECERVSIFDLVRVGSVLYEPLSCRIDDVLEFDLVYAVSVSCLVAALIGDSEDRLHARGCLSDDGDGAGRCNSSGLDGN